MNAPAHFQYPSDTPILAQSGWQFRASRDGLASFRQKFRGPALTLLAGIFSSQFSGGTYSVSRGYRSPHPLFPSLGVYSAEVTGGKGLNNIGTLDMEWRGLDPRSNQIPPPVYELDRSTGNEPLETHPKWVTDIAGKPSAPKNSAIFVGPDGTISTDDATATFKEFAAVGTDGQKNPWVGRSDYLVAGSIFKKTYCSYSPPGDMGSVGHFSSPDGPAPSPPAGYDWFFLGESYTDESAIYHITASWRLVPTDDAAQIIYG